MIVSNISLRIKGSKMLRYSLATAWIFCSPSLPAPQPLFFFKCSEEESNLLALAPWSRVGDYCPLPSAGPKELYKL